MIGTRFDRFGGTLVRFCYIIGAVLGIFAIFSHLAVTTPELTWGFGAVVAGALVLHEFLQTRRVLLVGSRIVRGKGAPEEISSLKSQLVLNLVILAVLLGFNAFAMWGYLTQVTTGQYPIPVGISNVIEALALPAFGLVASLLMEVNDDASLVLQRAANDMLFDTTNRAVKQWKNRVKDAVKQGHNLAPISVDLMLDSGDADGARRIKLIEQGLQNTEHNGGLKSANLYVPQSRLASAAKAVGIYPTNLTPSEVDSDVKIIPAGPVKFVSRKTRSAVKLSPQKKVHNYMNRHPEATLEEVMEKCHVTKPTAIKYRNEWKYLKSFEDREEAV